MRGTGSDPRLRELRRYESILVLSGFGVIAFGLWSIVRAAIYYFLNPFDIESVLGKSEYARLMAEGKAEGVEFITENLGYIAMAFLFIVLVIDLLLRVYVGMSARAYGRARKKRTFFIILAWIMAVFSFFGIISTIVSFVLPVIKAIAENSVEAIESTASSGEQAASVSMFVDVTSLFVLIELAVSGMKVKRIRKDLDIKSNEGTSEDYFDDMAEIQRQMRNITGDLN